MKQYKYQMHAHTHPCSACSLLSPEELVESLRAGGYAGCVITNHFLHGNTGIDRRLAWEDFVAYYERDYLECKELAEKYDIDILFGVEEGVGGALEILCYGITPELLYRNPKLANGDLKDWYRVMKNAGAVCIQAHPYRERNYIPQPGLLPLELIDGIEITNTGNMEKNNLEAEEAAKEHPEWILVAGGDCHTTDRVCSGGIATNVRIRTEQQLAQVLRSGEFSLITK